MTTRNFLDKCRRYFWFPQAEFQSFLVAVIGLAFVASWTQWGTTTFDFATGMKNWLAAILLVGITIFVHHAGQRLAGLYLGFYAEQKLWWYGLMVSLILVLITNGNVKFLAATSTVAHLLPAHRLGKMRYGPNLVSIMKVCVAGPLANILFAGLIKTLQWAGTFPGVIGDQLFVMNMAFAAWNLLPIPPLDGSKLFYWSRMTYAFMAAAVISYAILIWWLGVYSYIYAGLIGIAAWLCFYIFFERKWA